MTEDESDKRIADLERIVEEMDTRLRALEAWALDRR